MTLKKIGICFFLLIYISCFELVASEISDVVKKSELEKSLALKEFYEKFKKTKMPKWLEKRVVGEGTFFIDEEGNRLAVLNFENLLKKGTEKVQKKSFEKSMTEEIYMMLFEGGQTYLLSYFDALKITESLCFGVLVSNIERQHDFILTKTDAIKKMTDLTFERGNYFYYQVSQTLDIIDNEILLMHVLNFKQDIDKTSRHLMNLIDPSEIRNYIEIKRHENNRDLAGYRMEIYSKLSDLAALPIRERIIMNNGYVTKTYEWDEIRLKLIKTEKDFDRILSLDLFEKLSPKEQEVFQEIIKIEMKEVKIFFENLGYPPIDNNLKKDKH